MLDEPPRPAAFDGVASSMSHFGSAKQASTWLRGPESSKLDVQVIEFEQALGKDLGTSPWHVVSPRRYPGSDAVTLWGASLFDAYRFVIDGDRFEATHRSPVNRLPVSIPWNFVGVDNGRFIVPDPDGHKVALLPGNRTTDPTLLVFSDGGRLNGRMRLERRIAVTENLFREICGVGDGEFLKGGTLLYLVPTFSGGLATTAVFRYEDRDQAYLVVFDENINPIAAAAIQGSGVPSNDIAAEPARDGGTAFYVPTDDAIVKMVFDPAANSVQQRWARTVPVRTRLGTTPSLMDTPGGEKFVLVIDAKAAVIAGLNGLVAASEDTRPSQLIAVRREDDLGGRDAVLTATLPDWLVAVENSPAVRRDIIAVPNYSGYLPNGLFVPAGGEVPPANAFSWGRSADSQPTFETGVVTLQYDADRQAFVELWSDARTQFSGVVAISGGSNMLYGTGAEEATRKTYFYGYRLEDDENGMAGDQVIRQEIGVAPFRKTRQDRQGNVVFGTKAYSLGNGEIYDGGNNILILEDRSAIVSGARGLVRIRDTE